MDLTQSLNLEFLWRGGAHIHSEFPLDCRAEWPHANPLLKPVSGPQVMPRNWKMCIILRQTHTCKLSWLQGFLPTLSFLWFNGYFEYGSASFSAWSSWVQPCACVHLVLPGERQSCDCPGEHPDTPAWSHRPCRRAQPVTLVIFCLNGLENESPVRWENS